MIETYLKKIKQNKSRFYHRAAVVLTLSLLVVTAVFWQLKLTGITLAGEAFCGMQEHVHTDLCLAEGCMRKEHIHTATCYSDKSADLETQADWEATLCTAELSGFWSEDAVAVAKTQIGYTESSSNFELSENGERRGYTRYGEWYGNPYGNWSAMFVSFCLSYAEVPSELAPIRSGVETMRLAWDGQGLYADGASYIPTKGDLIFFDSDGDGNAEGMGIVCANDGGSLTVIAGDRQDAVCEYSIDRTDPTVLGYGSLRKVIRENASEEELACVDLVIGNIASLPSADTVGKTLAAYEEAEGYTAYQNYFEDTCWDVVYTYLFYESLGADLKLLVTNSERLTELDWMRYSPTFMLAEIQSATPRKIQSADTDELIEVNLYDYGSTINTLWKSNNKYPGFQWNGGAYKKSSLTYDRHLVDMIDFGNSMITDLEYGTWNSKGKSTNATAVGNNGGAINALYGVTNHPIGYSTGSAVMQYTLKNGYPALSDGTSLSYLFSQSTYAAKQNTQNINGLFQYNAKTGEYYYSSRENHAQYSNNIFTLYQQIITPNFIVYPFGNFLPFNDITDSAKATQVSKITSVGTYMQESINNLIYSSDYNTNTTKQQLLEMLVLYRTDLRTVTSGNGTAWNNWSAADAINDYFFTKDTSDADDNATGPVPSQNKFSNTFPVITEHDGDTKALLPSLYNIDYDVKKNFFFGMDMHMEFLMPKNGLTGPDGDQEMIYEFTGDDDVWVYIDGVLFLDMTGIHRHVGGKIDFVNGIVYYYALNDKGDGEANQQYTSFTFAEILTAAGKSTDVLNGKGTFKDYSVHTFDFYYMERGSGSSVCEINFNFPLLKKNSITVTKELVGTDTATLGNPDFLFQICTESGALFFGEGVEYTVADAAGNELRKAKTGTDGVFSLKAGETAIFQAEENAGRYFVRELLDETVFEQYGTVTVDGKSVTVGSYSDITVGSSTFKGVNSDVKDMSDGSTAFTFTNTVDPYDYGSLQIRKRLQEYTADLTEKEFTFNVWLDGKPLPKGTPYTVTDADGNKTAAVTAADGKLTFFSGQTVRIEKILAGTAVTLQEVENAQYAVIYTDGNGTVLTPTDGKVTQTVVASQSTDLTVINDRNGAKLTVNGQKTLLYPDGTERTFTFRLQECDADGNLLADGIRLVSTVTLESGSETFAFTLNFPHDSAEGIRRFRIWEDGADTLNGGDETYYILCASLSKSGETIVITDRSLSKNGSESAETAKFTNRNVRDLTLSKTVEGISANGLRFEFELTASVGSQPLSGVYLCTFSGSDTQTTVEFLDGKASLSLQSGETVTLHGLPYGTVWTVKENETAGFYTEYAVDGADRHADNKLGGTLQSDTSVAFYNLGGVELPSTGSHAGILFPLVGALMVGGSTVGACVLRRKNSVKRKKR